MASKADGQVVFEIVGDDKPLQTSVKAAKEYLQKQDLDVTVDITADKQAATQNVKNAVDNASASAEKNPVEVPVNPDPSAEWKNVKDSVKVPDVKVPVVPNAAPAKQEMPKIKSWFKSQADEIQSTLKSAFTFSLGGIIGNAISSIASAVTDFVKDSWQAASDLQEVQNVVDVTFGDDATVIENWSKRANTAFGLTELQAKKYTSTLGAMMKSSGLTGKAITSMSTDLAGLTADMASFYNLDFDDAFEKIRAGISGETEPLKQLGINMSVANLEAYALSQGIDTAYESMSQAEQVTLRYNYLMEATANAQGDFARTSDSLANSQRVLANNFETLKANLGEVLLPVVNGAVEAINGLFDALTPELDLTASFDQIEQDYENTIAEINSKEFTAKGLIDELAKLEKKTTLTKQEQLQWNAALNKLIETVPELSEKINLQTGEIEGGTQALRENTEAWAENSRAAAYAEALQEKYEALADAEYALAEARIEYTISYKDWAAAQKKADEYRKTIDDLMDAGGLSVQDFNNMEAYWEALQGEADALSAQTVALQENVADQQQQVDLTTETLEKATAAYDEYAQSIDNTTAANTNYQATSEEQIQKLDAVAEALQPLIDYQREVRDATTDQVNSVISGFDKMEVGTEATINGMIEGLSSQIAYMDTYATNMQLAAERGVDEGLLASLADGSVESAEYLAAILTGTDEDIAALNEKWLLTQEGKDTFADVLAAMKLDADDEYQAILDKATTTIAGLDMSTAAKTSLSSTVQGIIDGIDSKAPEVQAAVDNIQGMLDSLVFPDFQFGDIWLGGGIKTKSWKQAVLDGSNANGLDYVPFDGYISELHKGEAVLTAEEADVWRMGQAQGTATASMDYNAFAAAIWGQAPELNIPLVLDTGELVGAISTAQANNYASYERSGWNASV